MKTLKSKTILLIAGLFLMASCGGSTGGATDDSANQTVGQTRALTGSVPSSGGGTGGLSALMKSAVTPNCAADTVIATDTTGKTSTTDVADDCSFSLTLSIGKSYVVSFLKGDLFVATLIFQSGTSAITTSGLPLSNGSGPIDLGAITINGSAAIPENNPLDQCDQDDDGTSDLNDDDDNNDGITDDEEADCDLDGTPDEYDEDTSTCIDDANSNQEVAVLAVKPYDDPDGNYPVDLEREVKARIDCEIDQSSVTSETFYITSDDGDDVIDCSYRFASAGKRIECEHDDQDFLPDTFYVAVIDGVLCSDGRTVESTSWTWLTESVDNDEGCYEDQLDEQDDDSNDDSNNNGEHP